MNGGLPALLLNVAGIAGWFLLIAALLWREVLTAKDRTSSTVLGRFVLPVIAVSPWAMLAIQKDATTAFALGFRSWAAVSVDAQAIRDWRSCLSPASTTAPAPLWWPTKEYEIPLGVPVSRSLLPPAIAGLGADEVRVLPNDSAVLLAWEGGRAGWVRFVLVGGSTAKPPAEFREGHVRWQNAKPDVLAGVAEHH